MQEEEEGGGGTGADFRREKRTALWQVSSTSALGCSARVSLSLLRLVAAARPLARRLHELGRNGGGHDGALRVDCAVGALEARRRGSMRGAQ